MCRKIHSSVQGLNKQIVFKKRGKMVQQHRKVIVICVKYDCDYVGVHMKASNI